LFYRTDILDGNVFKLPPTFSVLHPLLWVFPETFDVVIPPGVAGHEVENAVVWVADIAEVAGHELVDAVVVVAGIVELQVSVDTALAFDVLVPVSVVAVGVDSSARPRSRAFPNVDYFASSSSSVEVVG
jgi:hypothetical protein